MTTSRADDSNHLWPDWLAGAMTDRERLRKILAAVHRCYMEHPEGGMVPTGPHMTVSMAENFIAQMLPQSAQLTPRPHQDGSEPQPGTFLERALLERFVTGGPVDLLTVRQQVGVLLSEIPVRGETAEDSDRPQES